VYAHANKAGWETWNIEGTGRGTWKFRSAHNNYLSANAQGNCYLSNGASAEAEWTITQK